MHAIMIPYDTIHIYMHRGSWVNEQQDARTTNKISIHANFHVCFSFGCHYNALFVLITISNTRSKRVAHTRKKICIQANFHVCWFCGY